MQAGRGWRRGRRGFEDIVREVDAFFLEYFRVEALFLACQPAAYEGTTELLVRRAGARSYERTLLPERASRHYEYYGISYRRAAIGPASASTYEYSLDSLVGTGIPSEYEYS